MLVHPRTMEQIAKDNAFTYWKSPDGYVYRAPADPSSKTPTGMICSFSAWEKVKAKIVRQ